MYFIRSTLVQEGRSGGLHGERDRGKGNREPFRETLHPRNVRFLILHYRNTRVNVSLCKCVAEQKMFSEIALITCFSNLVESWSYNFSWISEFLDKRKMVFVSVVAVVSNPASRNISDFRENVSKLYTLQCYRSSIRQRLTWEITISSTSSLSNMDSVLPLTSWVYSLIASVATSMKSWYFYRRNKSFSFRLWYMQLETNKFTWFIRYTYNRGIGGSLLDHVFQKFNEKHELSKEHTFPHNGRQFRKEDYKRTNRIKWWH